MNDEELFEKIMNKELTICETCDTIFNYAPQKLFCGECLREKELARHRKYREENPEKIKAYYEKNREKELARNRKYREENREKIKAQNRARYHAKKKQEEE